MPTRDELVRAAGDGRLRDLHDLLVQATADHEESPHELLRDVAGALANSRDKLPPRAVVVMRLLDAGAFDAAWAVVRDNAVGVVERTLRTSTSSGARPTATRLPLATKVEPPHVYAWLPGFRDPRYGAPDSAYDVSGAVTASVRLDEAWWDGSVLVLAGLASLRHLTTTPHDEVTILLRKGAREEVVDCDRLRRPDLVRGDGAELTRAVWAGWTARVDAVDLPRGIWVAWLRVVQQGIAREVRLGRTRLDLVPTTSATRLAVRAEARTADSGLVVVVGSPLLARGPGQVLHAVASRALGR